MGNVLGIRREDKNRWERRVPLTPAHVRQLVHEHGVEVIVQPSSIRAFPDAAYEAAGARVQEDLSPADVVLAVKEIPYRLFQPGKTYVFFSHTIKGQPYNMPMLRHLMDLGCQLIDYECIVDDNRRRLVFFGEHAGLAGMIESLRALGQRLALEGVSTPFADLSPAYAYTDLAEAQAAVRAVGERIRREGLPPEVTPLVVGIAGYGNVSRGAQAILDLLPVREITPSALAAVVEAGRGARDVLYKVVFREQDTVEPVEPGRPFDLQDFIRHPEHYRSKFAQYLPYLTLLVNCIYWAPGYPRLVTKEAIRRLYAEGQPRLRVIGDISCDIEGAIECTVQATEPDAPVYVWDPATDRALDGLEGPGPVIMAVDNLPCELPKESSTAFGEALMPFVPALAVCDFRVAFEQVALPPELKRAVIVYHGELTPAYQYLRDHVKMHGC